MAENDTSPVEQVSAEARDLRVHVERVWKGVDDPSELRKLVVALVVNLEALARAERLADQRRVLGDAAIVRRIGRLASEAFILEEAASVLEGPAAGNVAAWDGALKAIRSVAMNLRAFAGGA